jgi:hypothetical protein
MGGEGEKAGPADIIVDNAHIYVNFQSSNIHSNNQSPVRPATTNIATTNIIPPK